ncbi:MAG TPA: B-box zinc finger protein [Candidatus Brocadiia bacterium]|nr:B-box zinc finger protein [Candidatus Brocadiia bacterium]
MADTCINHPNKPAMTRCIQCHKPVCDECTVSGFYGSFCSNACQQKYKDYAQRKEAMEQQAQAHKGSGLLGKLIVLAVVIVGCVLAWKLLLTPEKQKELKDRVSETAAEVKEKASETATEVKEKAKEATEKK